MINYFGGKGRLAPLYPLPKHNLIIEPFAGGAAYSWLYHTKDIWLNDVDKQIMGLFKILQSPNFSARLTNILKTVSFGKGCDVSKIEMDDDVKLVINFFTNIGTSKRNTITSWAYPKFHQRLVHLVNDSWKVKNWHLSTKTYLDLPNTKATWFIDPPYQHEGSHYKFNNSTIDYSQLADWCKTRKGQVIVCESYKANWLPFVPFSYHKGQRQMGLESIWYKEK